MNKVATKISNVRLTILTKKYSGNSSIEDQAHIDILTKRLRKLDPRVTKKDLQLCEDLIENMDQLSTDLGDIIKEFSL